MSVTRLLYLRRKDVFVEFEVSEVGVDDVLTNHLHIIWSEEINAEWWSLQREIHQISQFQGIFYYS